ncbi:MAG: Sir2 silent information regulator family NAD-dependent deacetylase [Oscillospiraceae bacterium]|jgi:NAD-dependent SIR2 family protein deacetylase|nr:Sir2 silent information regulator family NAD-dependent deacetylase [Oscillospiraceae bacterium]
MDYDYVNRIEKAKQTIDDANFVLIGGGAGLSDAAGLHYAGRRFTDNFSDFIEKYGFTDMYTSSFHPFETQEERWAYWARHISLNRYDTRASALYKSLLRLAGEKEYFVITTNVEHQFIKAGFPENRVFAVQGDYGLFQCAVGCHGELYGNETQIRRMVSETRDCRIPSALVPKCPVCGGEMDVNIRHNEYFIQDDIWRRAERRYADFLKGFAEKRVVCLELGVGFNTPEIIRFPFERTVYGNERAVLIRINRDCSRGMKENEGRTIAFIEDMAETIGAIIPCDRAQEKPRGDKRIVRFS